METIKSIAADLKKAIAASKAGNELECARIAIGCQRAAAKSRSRHAYDIEFRAHCMAALAILRIGSGGDHATRSELGRIAAESKAAFVRQMQGRHTAQ